MTFYKIPNKFGGGTPALTYSPRLHFLPISDKLNLSINTDITALVNLGAASQTASGTGSSALGYELAGSLNLNLGQGAYKDSEQTLGGFIGVGYALNSSKFEFNSAFGGGESTAQAKGLYLTTGLRWEWYHVGLYMISGDNANAFGLRIVRPIGE